MACYGKWNPGEFRFFMLKSDDSGMGTDAGKAVSSLGENSFFSHRGSRREGRGKSIATQLVVQLGLEEKEKASEEPPQPQGGQKTGAHPYF